jgi:tRNA(Arg) A34 adenosine deaminase TadA
MGIAIEESRKSLDEGNVPVGSVIVKDGKIIGAGRNQANTRQDPTSHGETEAIWDACKKLGSGDLSGAVLYTALEPCPMCLWSMVNAKIDTVVMGGRLKDLDILNYGEYSVENLLAMTGRKMNVVTGVRVAECVALRKMYNQ